MAGTDRDTGAIAVDARDDMIARADTVEGLMPAYDFSEAPNPGGEARLAYRFEGHPWRAHLVIERAEPRLTAQTYSFFQVERDALGAHYEVAFDIAGARTRSLSVLLPKDTPGGPAHPRHGRPGPEGILRAPARRGRRRSAAAGPPRWPSPARAGCRLAIDFQAPLSPDTKELALPVVEADGVAYQSGLMAVEGSAELQVEVAKPLPREVDIGEFVDAEYQPGKRLLGTYGFVGRPPALKVLVAREPSWSLPPAIVQKAGLTTSVSAAGTAQSAARFILRTKAQFLEIQLPPQSTLWAVRLDGRPAKPQREGDRLLLSLPAAGAVVRDLQVVYETPADSLGVWRGLEVPAPKLTLHAAPGAPGQEVPAADLEWVLYLPSGFCVVRSDGSVMTDQVGRTPLAVTQLAEVLWRCGGGTGWSHGLLPAFVAVGTQLTDDILYVRTRSGETHEEMGGGGQGAGGGGRGSYVREPRGFFADLWSSAGGDKSAPPVRQDGKYWHSESDRAIATNERTTAGPLTLNNGATLDVQGYDQPVGGMGGAGGTISLMAAPEL